MVKYNKIVLSIIFYIVSIFIFNYYSYNNYREKEIAIIDDKLKIGAYAVYTILGEDFFNIAKDKDSISLEDDWKNIKKLSFYNNQAKLAFIYSSIKIDNKIHLTSSSASKEEIEEKSELHYFYHYDDAGEALINSFNSKKIVYENYTDKWGSFRAMHIPLVLADSRTIVISAEISLEHFNKMLREITYKYLLETLLYLLLTIPIILTSYFSIKEKTQENMTMIVKLMRSEKMAAMGEMIGNIAHQWRQPLSAISTGVTGMQIQKEIASLSDEDFNKTCTMVNANAQYLSKTIDAFRDFIKGDKRKIEFSLKDCINSFLRLVEGSIKTNNLNIVLDIEKDILINNYPNELLQCIFNIFNNSKDVLKEREIKDRYIFISSIIKNDNVIISIKDNGQGVSENILPNIFDPYFTTKHQSKGTGLGLSMTHNLIVKGMNGTIEASNITFMHNNINYTGLEFKITLPLT